MINAVRHRQLFRRYIELRGRHEALDREFRHLRSQFRQRSEIQELKFDHQIDESGVLYSGWNTGFFSNCTTLLWEMARLYEKDAAPKSLSFVNGFENFRDAEHFGTDIYPLLFVEDPSVEISRSSKWPFLDHHGHYCDQAISEYAAIAQRWMSPSEAVKSLEEKLIRNSGLVPEKTVAVVYRGTDKGTEVDIAAPELYIDLAADALQGVEGGRVLIQTDQEQVRDLFVRTFGSRCIFFSEMPVTPGQGVVHNLSRDNLGMGRLEFAQHVVAATLAVSRCRHIINHTGNMALWICLDRGNVEGVTQVDAHGQVICNAEQNRRA